MGDALRNPEPTLQNEGPQVEEEDKRNSSTTKWLLVRHCEKSKHSGESLSHPGEVHANVLAKFFKAHRKDWPIDLVVAQTPELRSFDSHLHTSNRPYQTGAIIADTLHVPVLTSHRWSRAGTKQLVQEVEYLFPPYKNNTYLCVWQHTNLPNIARQLGAAHCHSWSKKHFDQADKDDETEYDIMMVVEKHADGTVDFKIHDIPSV